MKIFLKSTIKNITDNTTEKDIVIAKKTKNRITYQIDNFKYTIVITSKKIIMNRKNDDLECTMYFEEKKETCSSYSLKEGYNIEINIKTNKLNITDKKIQITYTVIDTKTIYQYDIEMSEYNEHKKRNIFNN